MSQTSALVLFAHGARAVSWALPFQRLQAMLREQLPDTVIELAFLELMEPRLPDVVNRLVTQGCSQISVVPVFFGQGSHVVRDLPLMVDELRSAHPSVQLSVAAAVGESPAVLEAIAQYCRSTLEH
ncbi:MAG: CbiX/SirB N-terminal domain-containing protein [Burkholderiales bacterium]|jgi:sirohydrochlorin cobaltochelatase|nr:CbiX/SirB N-terminal domain-containing protein [Burkholderiales bacterium]